MEALNLSAYAQSLILQKLSGSSSVLSSTVGVPNSLGPGELLQEYGTKAQKDYYFCHAWREVKKSRVLL